MPRHDASRSRSRSASSEIANRRDLRNRLIEDIAPFIARDIENRFMELSTWIPADVNPVFIRPASMSRITRIFTTQRLRWSWYERRWWFWDPEAINPVYYKITYIQETTGYWNITVMPAEL